MSMPLYALCERLPYLPYTRDMRPGARRRWLFQAPRTWLLIACGGALTLPAQQAHFVGSKQCESCHKEIYDSWKQTRMAKVVQSPAQHPEAVLGDFTHANPLVTFGLDKVAFVYGSRWKQRYFTKVGDDYFVLPAQWDIANKKWLPFHVADGTDWWTEHYGADNMQRPTGPLCDGCHSVNYNTATKQVTEWNVGCEKCHGPGSEHAAHPSTKNIVNSAKLDTVRANDTCLQCHSQGRPKGNPIAGQWYDWPVGYLPGQRLADSWTFEESQPGKTDFYFWQDGTAHKNRMQGNDYAQALMAHREVQCSGCHNVHSAKLSSNLKKEGNDLCLDCHSAREVPGPGTTQTVAQHTHHGEGSQGSVCTACHMPKIEQTLPGVFVAAHTFRFVSPRLTEQTGMPNACNTCHKDRDAQWSLRELAQWTEISPWPYQPAPMDGAAKVTR